MGEESAQDFQAPGFYEADGLGVIRSKLNKSRVFIFPARTWAIMEGTLFQKFSTGAAVILREMGRTYGRQFGANLKDNKVGVADVWKLARDLGRSGGWGDVTIEGGRGPSLKITTKNCVFCSEAGHLDLQSCHFLIGVALGIGDALFESRASATETRCMRTGADACVIELSSS